MPRTKRMPVGSLKLDLKNFRTVPQQDEEHAIGAMIAVNPDKFWGLMESLLDDGYHPTENIIVLDDGTMLTVKEGNRRIAAMKIAHGMAGNVELPEHLATKITNLSAAWKKDNSSVPCAIYGLKECATVDKIVARTHAKGEKSSRDNWNAVAKARYGRDQKGQSEPGLDLLEKYLEHGTNRTPSQADRWAGDYPLSVFDEAVQKLATYYGCDSKMLVEQYPKKNKKVVDGIVYDIGIANLGFKELRSGAWGQNYGLQVLPPAGGAGTQSTTARSAPGASATPGTSGNHTQTTTHNQAAHGSSGSKPPAPCASNDPRSVRRKLRAFQVKGAGRDKIVTLLKEITTLKHEDHPHAFCFLLRSIFELSAKAYCTDHKTPGGPKLTDPSGKDKPLASVLGDIVKHMTGNGADKQKAKFLHGPITELGKPNGVLSVTSMNQLVHNPHFSITPPDISIMFGNIFPLVVEMNF